MVYQIYFLPKGTEYDHPRHTLFDIEYYLNQSDVNKEEWFSEISVLPIANELVYFLKEKFEGDSFDYKQFAEDIDEIQELRRTLYERYDNKPKQHMEARVFHYHVFGKTLKKTLYDFADKYGLYINID